MTHWLPSCKICQMDKIGKAKILRQSTDDIALLGYEQLALELSKIKNLSAIFIPTSSGTTAQGLHSAFKKLKLKPQIHIVQTSACHPIAINFSPSRCCTTTTKSIAGAIVDNIAHRKEIVIADIKNSHGFGWIADDQQIQDATQLVYKTEKIKLSPNSALAIVGLQQALKENWKFDKSVICLITGK